MSDLVMTPTDRARLLAIEAGLLDPAADGLGLAAMTPEARSEAARKSWLTRQRNKAGAGEAKPKTDQPAAAPASDHPSEDTQSGLSPKMLKAIGHGVSVCFENGKSTGNEMAVVIDKNGNQIGYSLGEKHSVPIGHLLTGKEYVTIHNHPTESSVSDDDISIFAYGKSTHAIVVDSKGSIATLSKPPGWKIPGPTGDWREKFYETLDKVYKDRTGVVPSDFMPPIGTPDYTAAREAAVVQTAKYLGLVYSRKAGSKAHVS